MEEEDEALRQKLLASLADVGGSARPLKPSDTHANAAAKKRKLHKMMRARLSAPFSL